jgi:methylmalonyl-CoA/ethylmalonyl-CoA epimerase
MKILNIDHLGVAVGNIADRTGFWTDLLGLLLIGSETVPEQKVTTAFFPVGESEVELLESTAPRRLPRGEPRRGPGGAQGQRGPADR